MNLGKGSPLFQVMREQEIESRVASKRLLLIRWLGQRSLTHCSWAGKGVSGKAKQELGAGILLRSLSKCPDSGCEQGCHTVKCPGSNSNNCFLITPICQLAPFACWLSNFPRGLYLSFSRVCASWLSKSLQSQRRNDAPKKR